MSRESTRDYFERIAPVWDHWHEKNRYYHRKMIELFRGMVPPGGRVLELGCGTGDLLAALDPAVGVGLNVAGALTALARQKHPQFQFDTVDVDEAKITPGVAPEYVVLDNMLDYVYDVWDLLENLRPVVTGQTLLVMTSNNPLWGPLLRFASRIGQRVPDSPRNFITNRDIRSVLELQGFDVVEEGMALPVPRRIPLVARS